MACEMKDADRVELARAGTCIHWNESMYYLSTCTVRLVLVVVHHGA